MYLYKILNKNNGKAYIGQTINKPEIRFNYHTSRLKKGTHDNEYLQRSFNKHGIDSFMFYTILKTDDLESLNLYEEQFIKILRATDRNFGYNIRPGGLNTKHSEETKKKLSEKRKGVKPTNMKPVMIDNIIYESLAEASKILNIPMVTIRWRVRSNNKKFNNYQYK
jgi:group I intron endonuclease